MWQGNNCSQPCSYGSYPWDSQWFILVELAQSWSESSLCLPSLTYLPSFLVPRFSSLVSLPSLLFVLLLSLVNLHRFFYVACPASPPFSQFSSIFPFPSCPFPYIPSISLLSLYPFNYFPSLSLVSWDEMGCLYYNSLGLFAFHCFPSLRIPCVHAVVAVRRCRILYGQRASQ